MEHVEFGGVGNDNSKHWHACLRHSPREPETTRNHPKPPKQLECLVMQTNVNKHAHQTSNESLVGVMVPENENALVTIALPGARLQLAWLWRRRQQMAAHARLSFRHPAAQLGWPSIVFAMQAIHDHLPRVCGVMGCMCEYG